ncbi:ribonuclease P 21kDa subunit [Rhodosporidium toruloides NP11] [Rhodotorula toruloides]|uniref:BY PROTMAP: gi/472586774/gb/EMS24293.1/ ribonuclease P 21kDa subunit [Rhodosporidium toruloides NP11] n=1 Tax=Rhodotorula toruloides TaxID=5286 RepID=A0A0K3CB77_RHOTO|nr:ribonuclease P 21kDa subunit [Rhodosporidium toruloides NP11] [Rhodotorula toruloides]
MGKKGRNTAAEPTAATPVVSRDSLQRLSYLYQASVLLNSALAGAAEDAAGKRKGGKRRRLSNEGAGPVGDEKEVSKGDQLMKDKDGEDATSEVQKAGEATERPHKRIRSRSDGLQPVAQRVAREMKEVAKKATVRMDPAVKRTVCQGCATVLVPGVTSTHPDPTAISSSIPASPAVANVAYQLHLTSPPPSPTQRQTFTRRRALENGERSVKQDDRSSSSETGMSLFEGTRL